MNYFAYHFTVHPAQPGSEILMAVIANMGFETFSQEDNGFTAFISEENNRNVNLADLYFEDFEFSWSVEKIEQKNWNEEWEKSFEPVRIGEELLIRAPFHVGDKDFKHEIVIMPKMSFGTGHHQTTQLICEAMLKHDFTGKRVLDMGSGTGVLAILAAKLGAGEVTAVDINEWSVENSRENCDNNDCRDVVVLKGDMDVVRNERPFQFILANINKNILKKHLPHYSDKLKSGGVLMLSGFFTTDVDELVASAEEFHLQGKDRRSKNEWAMLEMIKA